MNNEQRRNAAPTREQIEALRDQGLGWETISERLGYANKDGARKRYQQVTRTRPEEHEASQAAYAYLRDKDPRKVQWREVNQATGLSRARSLAILGALRRQYKLNEPDTPPPPPVWRDHGLGESIAYQRARERVERYVAAGDDRSAAVNQVYMETGVKVR